MVCWTTVWPRHPSRAPLPAGSACSRCSAGAWLAAPARRCPTASPRCGLLWMQRLQLPASWCVCACALFVTTRCSTAPQGVLAPTLRQLVCWHSKAELW